MAKTAMCMQKSAKQCTGFPRRAELKKNYSPKILHHMDTDNSATHQAYLITRGYQSIPYY